MERLTRATNNNKIHSHEPTDYGNNQDRTDLLGEYEDLGMTPEEIKELKESRDYWKREAKKWCDKLGEIRILTGQELCDE